MIKDKRKSKVKSFNKKLKRERRTERTLGKEEVIGERQAPALLFQSSNFPPFHHSFTFFTFLHALHGEKITL